MKLKIIIFLTLLIGSVACTHKTCPTYAKEDVTIQKERESV